MKLKDFPIMFLYFCKNIVKKGKKYSFDLFDWELLDRGFIGHFIIEASSREDLKNKILKKMRGLNK